MEIPLNKKLEPHPPAVDRDFIHSFRVKEYEESEDRWTRRRLKKRDIVRHTLDDDVSATHRNYLEYLGVCYANHYGVVVAPHLLWFTVLTEIAAHVKENAEHYRGLFTTSPEQVDLEVPGTWATIDPRSFLPLLRQHVPVSPDLFLPEFSTGGIDYDIAASVAFCDAVSPYYSYSMFLCGIPRIRVEGRQSDWAKFTIHLVNLRARLDLANEYLTRVLKRVDQITRSFVMTPIDRETLWRDFYSREPCGSGSQWYVKGWYREFFMDVRENEFDHNYPTQIPSMEITQQETKEVFNFASGLFSSRIEGGYLVPQFNYVVERLPKAAEEPAATSESRAPSP